MDLQDYLSLSWGEAPGSHWTNLALPNFVTCSLYTNIEVKGRLLSPLTLKCASNEHQGSIRDTRLFFPFSDLGCRDTIYWLPGVGILFCMKKRQLKRIRHKF